MWLRPRARGSSQLCSQLENVLSKIRPRVDMLWIITCGDRTVSFVNRINRYVRYVRYDRYVRYMICG